jgi:tetratricopeptide (TPR) repeat protein
MSTIEPGKQARIAGSRRRWSLLLFLLLLAVSLIWGGWAWWTGRRYRIAMAKVESEIMTGRFGLAVRDLEELLDWKRDPDGGLAFLLGCCEQSRGKKESAVDAWLRVPPGSAYADRAISACMRLFQDGGRLAPAESFIKEAARHPRNESTAVLTLLVPSYEQQGRIDEAERLLEARWERWNELGEGASEPAIKLVRQHIDLTWNPAPAETVRAVLDQAGRLDPEDDRIRLGRANLAIRTGAYDEAKKWLDALRGRDEDVPVWRARLNWGIATGRDDVVQEALTHLPASDSTPAQVHRLKARLAANRGDVATERRELERLCASDPADPTALVRLAQLAEKEGQPARAAELLRKKLDIDRLRARYDKLHKRRQPVRDAAEMAHLAEQLGRGFEARAFLTLAISEDPDREDLRRNLQRVTPGPRSAPEPGQTLARVLADEISTD